MNVVGREYLEELASMLPEESARHPTTGREYRGKFDLDQKIEEYNLPVARSGPWQGGRRWVLAICPWNSDHTDNSAYIVQRDTGEISAGCHHNGCNGKGWAELREVCEPGYRGRNVGRIEEISPLQQVEKESLDLSALRCVADVAPEKVRWLWDPRIPMRHLTALEGDPGEGKSFVTQAMAAGLSLGQGLPDREVAEPVNTLLLTAEDHIPTSVRPRLEGMGADLNRIFTFDDVFSLDEKGLGDLEQLVTCTSARLVVIDPIVAYLSPDLDINRANEVRAIMAGLAGLAERCDCAVVIVRHLAKGSSNKAIYRGLGSIDFTASCRSVLLAGHDADNQNARALVQIKSNLGPLAEGVGYSIEEGRFRWTGTTAITAGRILAPETEDSALSEARSLLQEMLAKEPKKAKEIQDEAKAAGISQATLRRAKDALKVSVHKEGFQGAWVWELFKDVQEPQDAHP